MTKLRVVHVSDIHFGQEKGGTKIEHDETRRKLLDDAVVMAAKLGPADFVLVLGDIAYSGKKEEYETAGDWLDRLTQSSGCLKTAVRTIPGNHDCDLSEVKRLTKTFHRDIRKNSVESAYADLEDMAKGREEANQILPKFRHYRDFAAGYRSDFKSASEPLWELETSIAPGVKLRFIGMNSAQISDFDDGLGFMILGNSQYNINDARHVINVVAMHHPLDWLKDRVEAEPYLNRRAKVLMFGHEHLPDARKSSDGLNNEWLEIYSGSTNPPKSELPYDHAYSWLEFELIDKTDTAPYKLKVTVHPRAWNRLSVEYNTDRSRIGAREFVSFTIECPDLIPLTTSQQESVVSEATSFADAHPSDVAGAGLTMSAKIDTDKAMDLLCFFFWRHLDWQQRLKVLVDADILPKTPDRPLAQTMERLALENARKTGKLKAVWEQMMVELPADKRQANPFN